MINTLTKISLIICYESYVLGTLPIGSMGVCTCVRIHLYSLAPMYANIGVPTSTFLLKTAFFFAVHPIWNKKNTASD